MRNPHPASVCGLVGLKPSRGRLTLAPLASEILIPEATEGVVTRTVRDTAAMLDAIHGSDMGEFFHAAPPERPQLDQVTDPMRNLGIAASVDPWGSYAPDPHIADEALKTAELLEGMGHQVVRQTPTLDFEGFYAWFTDHWIMGTLAIDESAEMMERGITPETVIDVLYRTIEKSRTYTLRQTQRTDYLMQETLRALDRFFVEHELDLVLTPTLATDTPQHGSQYTLDQPDTPLEEWYHRVWEAIPYTPLCNATGFPSISLPLGMHFFGRWGSEGKLINLAAQLEAAQSWLGRTPTIHVSGAK